MSRTRNSRKTLAFEQPLPWFRLWSEFAGDPKVQMLSEQVQRRFVMVLCFTGSRLIPTTDDSAIAFGMRISLEEALETKGVLIAAGLIRGADWFPTAWERRQFKSDHDSADRKRRQRRRDRHARVTSVSRDIPTPEGEGEQIQTQTQNRRSAESHVAAASHDDAREPVVNGVLSAKSFSTRSQGPKNARKNGTFEGINDAVEKLVAAGGCSPSDLTALARGAGITEPQAAVAVRQLRDRGRLQ